MSEKTFSGSVVAIENSGFDPSILAGFKQVTGGLSDAEIVSQVRYVAHDDPEIPPYAVTMFQRSLPRIKQIKGMRFRIALWPDGMCAALLFPRAQSKPATAQLLRAYQTARRMSHAIKLHDNQRGGSAR